MLILILAVLFTSAINGFFALSEMALMTARRTRLAHLAQTSRRAQLALALIDQPESFLSTVQIFMQLLSIGTGTALGAAIGERIGLWIDTLDIGLIDAYSMPIGIGLSIAGITIASMLFGELVPKRVALVDPERIAIAVALPMRVLTAIAWPLAFVLIRVTRFLLRVTGLASASRERVSEEEIRLLVSEGAEQGVIDAHERNMVNRVLRLGDRSVDSIMTPRPRISWLDVAASAEDNLALMRSTPYSRFPVYRESEQDVIGVLEVKTLLGQLGSPRPELFRTVAKPLYVPSTARALDLLEEFRDAQTPLALVVDEYGDIEGLVTLNDLLAAVVGKTSAPLAETHDQPIVTRADGSWLVDGSVAADDLRELLGLTLLPNEEDHDYRTAAGMVMAQFGRIPQVGESFVWGGFRFEVLDLDGARIDKLLIARQAGDEA